MRINKSGVAVGVAVLLLWLGMRVFLSGGPAKQESQTPQPRLPEGAVPVAGLYDGSRVVVITQDQLEERSKGYKLECLLPATGKSCPGERLGRFSVSCSCAQGLETLLLDGNQVPRVDHVLPARNDKMFLVACTMSRGDDEYLDEWIRYHAFLGFERFIIYSDEPKEALQRHTRAVLAPHVQSGLVEFVEWWPAVAGRTSGSRQMSAFTHCMHRMQNVAEWIAIFDVDEFFFLSGPHVTDSLPDLIRQLAHEGDGLQRTGSLFVPQSYFGARGSEPESGSVPLRFRFREANWIAGTRQVHGKDFLVGKSISRPDAFRSLHTAHSVELAKGWDRVQVPGQVLRVNHYFCKSLSEQAKRENSGGAWRSKLADWQVCSEEFAAVEDNGLAERFVSLFVSNTKV